MRIQAINRFNSKMHFGNFSTDDDETPRNAKFQQRQNKSFYEMTNFGKLNVIYDMLLEQKQDLVTLSRNQHRMQNFNNVGFRVTAVNAATSVAQGQKSDAVIESAANSFKIDVLG